MAAQMLEIEIKKGANRASLQAADNAVYQHIVSALTRHAGFGDSITFDTSGSIFGVFFMKLAFL